MKQRAAHLATLCLLTALTGANLPGCDSQKPPPPSADQLHTVTLDTITKSVLVAGVIRPTDIEVLRNEVGNGSPSKSMMAMGFKSENPTLIYMIPEGAKVQQGDILWEVQSDNLRLIGYEREFQLLNSQAMLVKWNERLSIEKLQAESWIMTATLHRRFADENLKKYIEGDAPLYLQKFKDAVTRARNKAQLTQNEYNQSIKLYANGYITPVELEADKLLAQERQTSKELAESALSLFETYTYPRQVFMFKRNIEFANINLYKAQISSAASVANAQRLVDFFTMDVQMRTDRLDYINEQIADTKTYAPVAGTVIYAASNGRGRIISGYPPLELGDRVSMKEHVVHLFSSDRMHLAVKLMEQDLFTVKVGQQVHITAETFPDRIYLGEVSDIALLASQESVFTHPDLYQYKATIDLVGATDGLHPGMNCSGEIILQTIDDTPTVPDQSIAKHINPQTGESSHTVYVIGPNGPQPKMVTLGLRNAIKAQVIAGLTPGDQVLLGPPNQNATPINKAPDPWINENRDRIRQGITLPSAKTHTPDPVAQTTPTP